MKCNIQGSRAEKIERCATCICNEIRRLEPKPVHNKSVYCYCYYYYY